MKYDVPEEIQSFHKKYAGSVRWKLTENGIEVEGAGVERSTGEPRTVTRIWNDYHEAINEYASQYNVPVELIVATIATETSGNPSAVREEPGYTSDTATPNKVSPGIMQTLLSTAQGSLGNHGYAATTVTRSWLLTARNSINAGTSYIADQKSHTNYDPVLVAAAYNAGSLRQQNGEANRFKLMQWEIGTSEHCDRFISWFNDFWSILGASDKQPAVSFWEYFHTAGAEYAFPVNMGGGRKVTETSINAYYDKTEKNSRGGYFPVGANTVWHGGVHLHVAKGKEVYACLPGKIIAARLADTAVSATGHYGSKNFILLQHKRAEKIFYSLYMHLDSVELDPENNFIKEVEWIGRKTFYHFNRVRNYRDRASIQNNDALGSFSPGDEVEFIADANPSPWKKVKLGDGTEVYVSIRPGVAKKVLKPDQALLDNLKEGDIVKLDIPVSADQLLWKSGEYGSLGYRKGLIHWEIFSENNLFPPKEDESSEIAPGEEVKEDETAAPGTERSVLVRGVAGPEEAFPNTDIKYHITSYNVDNPTKQEKKHTNWVVELDGVEVIKKELHGDLLEVHVEKAWKGKNLIVKPYINTPTNDISAKTKVGWLTPLIWHAIEDNDSNFNMDSQVIMKLFDDSQINDDTIVNYFRNSQEILTTEELQQFYSSDPDVRKLRSYACKFVSEWGIQDLDNAIEKLKGRWVTYGLKEHIEQYQWWKEAKDAGCELPSSENCWHYNPIAVLQEIFFESNKLATPATTVSGTHYGGYALKKDDKDANKKWAGEVHESEGAYVEELQKDLLRIGYWVSNPESVTGKGMLCDGSFGKNTENALKTFQFEHFVLNDEGNIDTSKKDKITGVLDTETANKIKAKIASIGSKAWDRPGHKAHATWQAPPGTGAYTPNKTYNPSELFYQLPPSEGYYREGVEYGSRTVKTRTNKWRCTPFKVFGDDDSDWLMADCWGKKSQIKMLKEIGDSWLKKEEGTPRTVVNASGVQEQVKPFAIRDIGGFNGGAMHSHNTHQNGSGTDLSRASDNPMCNTPLFTSVYERNETYELSKMLVDKGAKRVLFNCHYIIKNIEKAQQLSHHSDHIHVDGPQHDGNGPMLGGRYTSCNNCGILSTCGDKIYKVFYNGEWRDYASNNVYDSGSSRGPGAVKLFNSSNQLQCKTQAEWLADADE